MLKRFLLAGRYVLIELLGTVAYGVVLYSAYDWFAEYSPLWAYFGTLVVMIVLIGAEEYSIRMIESEDGLKKRVSDPKKLEKTYRSLLNGGGKNISVKTVLYLFYVLMLIFSKVIEYYPRIVNESIRDFILSNSYTILLLIALDRLIGQFLKDRDRWNRISARLQATLQQTNPEAPEAPEDQ